MFFPTVRAVVNTRDEKKEENIMIKLRRVGPTGLFFSKRENKKKARSGAKRRSFRDVRSKKTE